MIFALESLNEMPVTCNDIQRHTAQDKDHT